jgi:hypothetical protein
LNTEFIVYGAGPISGLTYDGAQSWRDYAKEELRKRGVKLVSPLRAKDYLRGIPALTKDCAGYGELNCMSSPRGIMTRDHYDATRANALLVNMLGAQSVSIGTVMEIAWAWDNDVPVVLVMEEKGNVHEHAMLNEATGFRVTTLDEAIHVIAAIADNDQTVA